MKTKDKIKLSNFPLINHKMNGIKPIAWLSSLNEGGRKIIHFVQVRIYLYFCYKTLDDKRSGPSSLQYFFSTSILRKY
jgi:hypothetical protein